MEAMPMGRPRTATSTVPNAACVACVLAFCRQVFYAPSPCGRGGKRFASPPHLTPRVLTSRVLEARRRPSMSRFARATSCARDAPRSAQHSLKKIIRVAGDMGLSVKPVTVRSYAKVMARYNYIRAGHIAPIAIERQEASARYVRESSARSPSGTYRRTNPCVGNIYAAHAMERSVDRLRARIAAMNRGRGPIDANQSSRSCKTDGFVSIALTRSENRLRARIAAMNRGRGPRGSNPSSRSCKTDGFVARALTRSVDRLRARIAAMNRGRGPGGANQSSRSCKADGFVARALRRSVDRLRARIAAMNRGRGPGGANQSSRSCKTDGFVARALRRSVDDVIINM